MTLHPAGTLDTSKERASKGMALLIVLSILLILAMLGVVFVTRQSLEKRIAMNFTDDVRAKLMAQSGIEAAVEHLGLRSGGFQYTNAGGLSVASLDRTAVYFGDTIDENNPPDPAVPLRDAVNPSFAVELDGDPSAGPADPKTLVIGGQLRGVSGHSATGTYALNGDVYALRVTPESGKINVNDGARWGRNHQVTRNLERVLNVLGSRLATPIAGLGTTLMDNRPAWDPSVPDGRLQGYRTENRFLDLFSANLRDELKEVLTIRSWGDRNVANPAPLSAETLSHYPAGIAYARPAYPEGVGGPVGQPAFRHGHQRNYLGQAVAAPLRFFDPALLGVSPYHNAIYGYDSLFPYWIEIVERSPVDVNAAGVEVLAALLIDLQGFFSAVERRRDRPITSASSAGYGWLDQVYSHDFGGALPNHSQSPPSTTEGGDGDECGFLYTTMKYVDAAGGVAAGQISAQTIADEIVACRRRVNCGIVHADNGTAYNHAGSEIDYGLQPFGGPFRTWAQFNAFVDHLVRRGVIYEDRGGTTNAWFFDYNQDGSIKSGLSKVQNWMAAQAAGDVLKANFNPNLTLNETHPDRNLWLYVDKTDLIANSAEFCFFNLNGAHTVESMGLVLRPSDGNADVFAAADNEVMGRRRATAVVQLWDDPIRITHMNDFRGNLSPAGEPDAPYVTGDLFADRAGVDETDNNYSVEIGPEPENGPLSERRPPNPSAANPNPREMRRYRYSGYVALPTYGGVYHAAGAHKPPNVYVATTTDDGLYPSAMNDPNIEVTTGYRNETIHSHFTLDATAHYHLDRANFASEDAIGLALGQYNWWMGDSPSYPSDFSTKMATIYGVACSPYRASEHRNFDDRYEGVAGLLGMYHPNRQIPGGGDDRYRLAKSFTLDHVGAATDPPAFPWNATVATGGGDYAFVADAALDPPAGYQPVGPPSDLRIDGQYMERGTIPGYLIHDLEAWKQSSSATYVNNSSWRFSEGTSAFWFKPNWHPAATGKIRKFLSMARYRQHAEVYKSGGIMKWHDTTYGAGHSGGTKIHCNCNSPWTSARNPLPFALYYFPAHVSASGTSPTYDSDTSSNLGYTGGVGKLRPSSLGFGVAMTHESGQNWQVIAATHPSWISSADTMSTAANAGNLCHFVLTPPLNHEAHVNDPTDLLDPVRAAEGGNPINWLRPNEWVHMTVSWKMPMSPLTGNGNTMQLFVNGTTVPGTKGFIDTDSFHPGDPGHTPATYTNWWLAGFEGLCQFCGLAAADGGHPAYHWGANSVRLGGEPDELYYDRGQGIASTWSWSRAENPLPHLFTADGTLDEFFHWTHAGGSSSLTSEDLRPIKTEAADLWALGRYYHPADTTNAVLTEATYTTKKGLIDLGKGLRTLPPATAAAAPPADGGGGGGGTGVSVPASPAPTVRLIGVSWTVYGEAYNPPAYGALPATEAMIPYLLDWTIPDNPAVLVQPNPGLPALPPENPPFEGVALADLYVQAGATLLGPYRDEAFSPILQPGAGGSFAVAPADLADIRIKVRFRVGTADPVLLATPVLDDITLFTSTGGPRFLSMSFEID